MSDDEVYVFPAHWPRHDQPHDYLSCHRCLLQADHVEQHLDCLCLDHDWFRAEVGTPAVPELVWVCGGCLKVQGRAYAGPFEPYTGLPADLPPGRHPFDAYLIALERALGRDKAARFLGLDPVTGDPLPGGAP